MAEDRRPRTTPRTRDEAYAAAYRELWRACDALRVARPPYADERGTLERSVVQYARNASKAGITRSVMLLQLSAALDPMPPSVHPTAGSRASDLLRQALHAYHAVWDGARASRDVAEDPQRFKRG